ncbi:hypothetical protein B0T11DRAFT_296325 [Plectosphaerella cucumerina]|uniref:Uncharacterized protein n=1 Tax=Plectosphaerella cucumerina TaxID=40658 RepID=A0A8K0TN91_9PEZI|nr:hypothetical protein B0T11DRAFT_296325 [Plectosphaerella cucumerina]
MSPHRPPLPLVSREDLARLRVRSEENDKLAENWSRDDVVLVAMNWRSEREFGQRLSPSLALEIMRRNAPPGADTLMCEARYTFNFQLEPWEYGSPPQGKIYYMREADAKAKLEPIFAELASRYSKVCVCSLRPRNVLNGLATLGFRLPKGTVVVDLVKVVEFQSAPDSIDDTMTSVKGEVVERQTRYGAYAGAGHLTGGAYPSRVLATVGPRAHGYTKDLRKMIRESKAAERLREPLAAREVMSIRRERPRVGLT